MDRVHVFTSSPPGNCALSLDPTGANLPIRTSFTYSYWKTITLPGDRSIAGDPTDIIAALQAAAGASLSFGITIPQVEAAS